MMPTPTRPGSRAEDERAFSAKTHVRMCLRKLLPPAVRQVQRRNRLLRRRVHRRSHSDQFATSFASAGKSGLVAMSAIGIAEVVVALLQMLVLRNPRWKNALAQHSGAEVDLGDEVDVLVGMEHILDTEETGTRALRTTLTGILAYLVRMHSFGSCSSPLQRGSLRTVS